MPINTPYTIGDIIPFKNGVNLRIEGTDKSHNDPGTCTGCYLSGGCEAIQHFIDGTLPECFLPMGGFKSIIFRQVT